MEFGKVLMAGVMAGIMVGIIAGILVLGINTVGFAANTVGRLCMCLAPFTCLVGTVLNVAVFGLVAFASLGAGLFAAKKVAGFSGPGDAFVGGAVGGLISGIAVALCATVAQIIYPIFSAILDFIFQIIGFATAKKQDIGALIMGAVQTIIMNFGWVAIAAGVFFLFGIILGVLGGIGGSLIFKASGKAKD